MPLCLLQGLGITIEARKQRRERLLCVSSGGCTVSWDSSRTEVSFSLQVKTAKEKVQGPRALRSMLGMTTVSLQAMKMSKRVSEVHEKPVPPLPPPQVHPCPGQGRCWP